jgi:uncharacterized phage protein (TIGR02218 family)
MKSATTALAELMNSNQFMMADLYLIALKSGETLRWTSTDFNVVWAGVNYTPVPISRNEIRLVRGIEVSTLTLMINPDDTVQVAGNPFLVACKVGALDGATLILQRGYFTNYADPCVGVLHLFEGTISVESADGMQAELQVRDYISLFNVQMPRNSYQPSCNNTLYDAGCGVSRVSRQVFGTVLANSSKLLINHNLQNPVGYFNQGVIEFITGVNAGVISTIQKHLAGTLGLSIPLKSTPSAGDTFYVYPGCDRTLDTCKNTYNNVIRFRGQPWIPKPETAF